MFLECNTLTKSEDENSLNRSESIDHNQTQNPGTIQSNIQEWISNSQSITSLSSNNREFDDVKTQLSDIGRPIASASTRNKNVFVLE